MQNKITLVIAPKGSGKTHEVSRMLTEYERVAVFDMLHETAYNVCVPCVGKPREFAQSIQPGTEAFKVVYRPVVVEMDSKYRDLISCPEFEPFVKLCFLRGNVTMVIDEAHLLCDSRNCPKSLLVSNLVGRHRRLDIVVVAQRFSGIHSGLRANADEFKFWRIIEPSDLDAIAERCGKDVAKRVQTLRVLERDDDGNLVAPGQMLVWDKLKGVVVVTE